MSSSTTAPPVRTARARARVTFVTIAVTIAVTVAALCAAASPRDAGAQILRGSKARTPLVWVSLSPGYFQTQSVNDGSTQSVWDFGSGLAWRGALEMGLGGSSSFGVMGTYAHMPLRFYQGALLASCHSGCDAHANVMGLAASFHAGGANVGLFQVIEATAGATLYRGFSLDRAGDTATLPTSDTDLNLTIGYGFGYQVNRRMQIAIVQDLGAAWHQRKNLPNDAGNMVQQQTTRLTVRLGAGQRGAVR